MEVATQSILLTTPKAVVDALGGTQAFSMAIDEMPGTVGTWIWRNEFPGHAHMKVYMLCLANQVPIDTTLIGIPKAAW